MNALYRVLSIDCRYQCSTLELQNVATKSVIKGVKLWPISAAAAEIIFEAARLRQFLRLEIDDKYWIVDAKESDGYEEEDYNG